MLVTKFSIDKSKRCKTAWLNLRTLLSMHFFTYKVSFSWRTVVWPTRRTMMCVHCEKTFPYTTFWLTWMCSHENFLTEARVCIQLVQFPMLCSTDMFPRSVSTTRRIHARIHTLTLTLTLTNKVQHHNFLTYEPFSLCNFWLTRTSHIGWRVCVQLTT